MNTETKGRKQLFTTINITRIGILSAMAVLLYLVEFLKIHVIPRMYTLDFSNVAVMLGAFAMGPAAGTVILILKEIIHFLFKGLADTAGVGDLADLIAGIAFILPACFLYRKHKTRGGAAAGMALGTACMVITGVLANWLILFPFYGAAMGLGISDIVHAVGKVFPFVSSEKRLLFFFVAPFNLIKGLGISLITFLIYKPLSPYLHGRIR